MAVTAGVDIARWRRQERWIAAALPTALGACGVVAAAAGLTTSPHSTGERVAVGVIGAVLLAIGLGLAAWRLAAPPRGMLDTAGDELAVRDLQGTQWSLAWPDIAGLQLVRTTALVRGGWYAGGPRVRIWLPRHYLVIRLRPGVTCPPALRGPSPHEAVVDLGVPGRTAGDVATALGGRLAEPAIRRVDRATSERLHWA